MDMWTKRLAHLDHCRGMSWEKMKTILKDDSELKKIYYNRNMYWEKLFLGNEKMLKEFLKDLNNDKIIRKISAYHNEGINIVSIIDPSYPKQLKEVFQPPWLLYYKGDLQILQNKNILAFVGTNKPTKYGESVIKLICPSFVNANIPIVSGLMDGIDAVAKNATLNRYGQVIAIVSGGFSHIYPEDNKKLVSKILRRGLLISESFPDKKPQNKHFFMRDRLISGLSKGIIVVEEIASIEGRTMRIVGSALDLGRDVFAVPGSIYSKESSGVNKLIKEGATPITCSYDILKEWDLVSSD